MKMFIITSIREDMQAVTDIFEKATIPVFSVSDTIGHKADHTDYLLSNWFGTDKEETAALLFFSFTEDEKADQALKLVKAFNEQKQSLFPVRAFILPVLAASY